MGVQPHVQLHAGYGSKLVLTMRSFKVLHGSTYSCLQLNDTHAIIKGLKSTQKEKRGLVSYIKNFNKNTLYEENMETDHKNSHSIRREFFKILEFYCQKHENVHVRDNMGDTVCSLINRLLAKWESRSPKDGHFSEKINMNNHTQSLF